MFAQARGMSYKYKCERRRRLLKTATGSDAMLLECRVSRVKLTRSLNTSWGTAWSSFPLRRSLDMPRMPLNTPGAKYLIAFWSRYSVLVSRAHCPVLERLPFGASEKSHPPQEHGS
jgi:hypothetical protein